MGSFTGRLLSRDDFSSIWRSSPYPHVTVNTHFIHKGRSFTGYDMVIQLMIQTLLLCQKNACHGVSFTIILFKKHIIATPV